MIYHHPIQHPTKPIAYVTNYGPGQRNADGTVYGGSSCAASRSLPFGTKIKLHYKGKTYIVTVHDRLAKRFDNRIDLPSRGFNKFCGRRIDSAYMRYEIIYRPRIKHAKHRKYKSN